MLAQILLSLGASPSVTTTSPVSFQPQLRAEVRAPEQAQDFAQVVQELAAFGIGPELRTIRLPNFSERGEFLRVEVPAALAPSDWKLDRFTAFCRFEQAFKQLTPENRATMLESVKLFLAFNYQERDSGRGHAPFEDRAADFVAATLVLNWVGLSDPVVQRSLAWINLSSGWNGDFSVTSSDEPLSTAQGLAGLQPEAQSALWKKILGRLEKQLTTAPEASGDDLAIRRELEDWSKTPPEHADILVLSELLIEKVLPAITSAYVLRDGKAAGKLAQERDRLQSQFGPLDLYLAGRDNFDAFFHAQMYAEQARLAKLKESGEYVPLFDEDRLRTESNRLQQHHIGSLVQATRMRTGSYFSIPSDARAQYFTGSSLD